MILKLRHKCEPMGYVASGAAFGCGCRKPQCAETAEEFFCFIHAIRVDVSYLESDEYGPAVTP